MNKTDPTGTEGVVDDAIAWGQMVVHDLGQLAGGIAKGEFGWALGGLPPTLTGGIGGVGSASLRLATTEARAGSAGLTRAEQIAANAAQGAKGEAATARRLGDNVAGKQVTFRTSDGTRTRADFVTKDRSVVETKTGNASLSKGQEKLHSDINAGRPVTPVGQNARDAGLRPGEPVRMRGCSIDRPSC